MLRRKNGKAQKRGKINFIGRLQLSTDKHREEDNEAIVALRILRTQVWITFSPYENNILRLPSHDADRV